MNADFIPLMEELIRGIVRSFAGCEDQVEVLSIALHNNVTFTLQVNSSDLEKHFAMEAKTLRALKVILVSVCARRGLHMVLEVGATNTCSDVPVDS